MKQESVAISLGNTKLGKKDIPNVSFTPILSCVAGVPCARDNECYALQAYRQYPNTKKAWDRNLRIYLNDPVIYFEQINEFLQNKLTLFFRWFVGGDIQDVRCLLGMVEIAVKNPQTQFMAFTKNYGVLAHVKKKDLPKNLNIIASGWPNYPMPKYIRGNGYTIAWLGDERETRIRRKHSIKCEGASNKAKKSCIDCLICWDKKEKRDIILPKH